MHCRPLLRLYKMMSTEAFQLRYEEGKEEDVNSYIDNTKIQLQSSFINRNMEDKDLQSQLKFGSMDDRDCENKVKRLLKELCCKDIQLLLECDKFSPKLFESYIKLMNYLRDVNVDCETLIPSLFKSGDKLPRWVRKNIKESTIKGQS